MDGVAKDRELIVAAIHEHIENAGVHSGDAIIVSPPQGLTAYQMEHVRDVSRKIAKRLNITGPVNIQCAAKVTDVMCIEVDFIETAAKVIVGADTSDMNLPTLETRNRSNNFVGVKATMFSFTCLRGSDPVLGVEMASTGEVVCFGANKEEAFPKALLSTGFKMPKKNIFLSVQSSLNNYMTHTAYQLHGFGYNLFATKATGEVLQKNGVPCTIVGYGTLLKRECQISRMP
jgi:carbamoylphosphate synthase large subunit